MSITASIHVIRPILLAVLAITAVSPDVPLAAAQGCMPSRFASPTIGAKGDVYLSRNTWQVGFGYRRATSNQKIIGHTALDVLPNGKKPSVVDVNTVDFSAAYGISDRLSLSFSAPLQRGTHTTNYLDGLRHENTASGLGDVTLVASYWLFNANPLQPGGNIAVGLGVKVPSGRHDVLGTYWRADHTPIPFPVHPSIQLGDGGWGAIVQVQGFQPALSRLYLYGAGSYTLSTRVATEVPDDPGSPVHWAVPDTWDARAGAAVAVWPAQGISATLGLRFNGTTHKDLIGGGDTADRLPATAGFLDPGLTLTFGAHTVTVNLPLRIYQNFPPSPADLLAGDVGGGGLSRYLIQAGYSYRF